LRHVVALPQTRARQPLLPGTEHFAAPWLRYWHEQADQPAVEDVACYSVLGAVVSRRGATWHDNKPFVPADLGHEGKVPSIACPDDTLLLRTVQSPCMVISGHQGDSYQNRVWDWMLRVGTARHLAQSLNLPLRILLDNAAPDWVPNLIRRVWGIGPDAIEIYDPESERVFLQHALLPTNPLGVHGLHPFFDGVINEIAAYERPPSSAPKIRRIFLKQISPNQQPNHGCCNEMDLIQAAALYGFMPISIENLSWLGRIKLFSEADIVVNNSDRDMTSALFCRSKTRFASVGFRTILTSEIGTLRNVQNSYFMLGTESSSQYRVELKAFSEFLVRLCS